MPDALVARPRRAMSGRLQGRGDLKGFPSSAGPSRGEETERTAPESQPGETLQPQEMSSPRGQQCYRRCLSLPLRIRADGEGGLLRRQAANGVNRPCQRVLCKKMGQSNSTLKMWIALVVARATTRNRTHGKTTLFP